jgi:alpha-glucosidase
MTAERLTEQTVQAMDSWNGALYQIYPSAFNEVRADSEALRGEGSIRGITERLDYLKGLGIKAIWISPFYPSPMVDGGYDVRDYKDVDPRYGSLGDLEEMIKQAHERDIKVMVDIVPNHTSDQHGWFKQSRKSRDNPKSDRYIWADPKYNADGNRMPPNNWGSVFSISQRKKYEAGELELATTEDGQQYIPPLSAWHYDETRGQYYLADFAPEQPNLNWANPEVVEAMKDTLRFWIDRGVDGFRVDVVDHIGKDPELRDDVFTPDMSLENPYDQLSRDKSVRYWPELEPRIRELTSVLDEYPDRNLRMILEAHASTKLLHDIDQINPGRAATFNFARLKAPWDARIHDELIREYQEFMASLPGGVPNEVNGNHDIQRLASRIGAEAARVAAVINLTLPGMITIYNGEEGGFTDVDVPQELCKDKHGYRDMARTPMLWDGSKNAGFSDADRTWLSVDPDYETKNLLRQAQDFTSSLALYKALLRLRNGSDVLRRGTYHHVPTSHRDVLAFARRYEGSEIITVANFTGRRIENIGLWGTKQNLGRIILSSLVLESSRITTLDKGLSLDGHEAVIVTSTE